MPASFVPTSQIKGCGASVWADAKWSSLKKNHDMDKSELDNQCINMGCVCDEGITLGQWADTVVVLKVAPSELGVPLP